VFDQLQDGFEFSCLSLTHFSLPMDAAAYVSRTASRVGYDADAVSQSIRDKIQAVIQDGIDMVRIGGVGRMTEIDSWDSERIVGREIAIKSVNWARVVSRMVSPRRAICFVLTLGEGLDRAMEKAALFEAYVLDGFGSELIEQVADFVEHRIVRWAESEGLACSRRFSPGYCDWPLAEGQKEIFSLLNPAAIGVSALDSGAMLPSKSISAVMISADRVPLAYPCQFCKKINCDHRRA